MSDTTETPSNYLELGVGDVSVVVRSDGEVEFLIAADENTEEFEESMWLVDYLKFVLGDQASMDRFEASLEDPPTRKVLN